MGLKTGRLALLPLLFFYLPILLFLGKYVNVSTLFELISDSRYLYITLFTLKQAALSTFIALLVGGGMAWVFGEFSFPFKRTLMALLTLPFLLPAILASLGIVQVYGQRGWLNSFLIALGWIDQPIKWLYSLFGIVVAHTFLNAPLFFRILYASWQKIPRSHYEAAMLSGASQRTIIGKVVLPQLRSSLVTGALVVFLYTLMSFSIILLLGGGPQHTTLEVATFHLMRKQLVFDKGAGLALIELIVTMAVVFLLLRQDQKSHSETGTLPDPMTPAKLHPIGVLIFFSLALFFLLPLFAILVRPLFHAPSRTASEFLSLHWFRRLGTLGDPLSLQIGRATLMSLRVLLPVALSSLLLAWIGVDRNSAYQKPQKKVRDVWFLMPIGVSSILIGISYFTWHNTFSPFVGITMAHTILTLPITYKILNSSYRSIDPIFFQMAEIDGITLPKRLFYIEAPLMQTALASAAILAAGLSLGEVKAAMVIGEAANPTLPVLIYQFLSTYRYGQASVAGVILITFSLLLFGVNSSVWYRGITVNR